MRQFLFFISVLFVTLFSHQAFAVEKSDLKVGRVYYVSYYYLNVRSAPTTADKNIVGNLNTNDRVELTNLMPGYSTFVQVRVISSTGTNFSSDDRFYVTKDYLSEDPQPVTNASRYFIIQNIATEKTRVYERCTESPNCPHRLVMETEMVVGRNEEGTDKDRYAFMTWLGHSKVDQWVKFYSDSKQSYPSWYSQNQDLKSIPTPISDSMTKLLGSQKWVVKGADGKDTVYGAFGWYAAKLVPADESSGVNYQWLHGTIGWGKDGADTIDVTRGILINIFSNPGSHGCTRLENRAIAFLRAFIAPGTDVYRVYARESTREKEVVSGVFKKKITPLPRYAQNFNNPAHWNYILLTDGAQQANGLTADARVISARSIQVTPGVNLLEEGVYDVDQYPNPNGLDYRYASQSGRSGDRYRIDSGKEEDAPNTHFQGYFLVDEGRFINYSHPDETAVKGKVHVSGLPDFIDSVPSYLETSGEHNPPEPQYPKENDRNSG